MNTEQPTANTQQNTNRIWFLGRFVYFIVCQPWVSFPLLTFLFLLGRQGRQGRAYPRQRKRKVSKGETAAGWAGRILFLFIFWFVYFPFLLCFLSFSFSVSSFPEKKKSKQRKQRRENRNKKPKYKHKIPKTRSLRGAAMYRHGQTLYSLFRLNLREGTE